MRKRCHCHAGAQCSGEMIGPLPSMLMAPKTAKGYTMIGVPNAIAANSGSPGFTLTPLDTLPRAVTLWTMYRSPL